MKIVIIGGGIAGLCMGAYLHRAGIAFSINERKLGVMGGGHAFLMHHDGLSILKELAEGSGFALPGKLVDTFIFKRPDGELVNELPLEEWQCFKRTALTAFLAGLLPAEVLHDNRSFSHFIYEDDKITAAAFTNGAIVYGDLFIGADGANSIVRNEVIGPVKFQPGIVKEIVGIVEHPVLAERFQGKFTKFQEKHKGLAFGLIPTTKNELVWFMQYDPSLGDTEDRSAEKLRAFCLLMLKGFSAEVYQIIEANDFNTSYVWNTRDFDLLPDFHHKNVVLIGDAAHQALPFTSAGTTNAMMDAKVLSALLLKEPDHHQAFNTYYETRSPQVAGHVHLGRELRNAFIQPDESLFTLPLIINQEHK